MRHDRPAARLTIFIGESDRWQHRPLHTEILHRAHAAGLAGASVLRGIEGFGATSRADPTRLLSLGDDLPVAIIIVDSAQRIEDFLPQLEELVGDALVIIDPVRVLRSVAGDVRT